MEDQVKETIKNVKKLKKLLAKNEKLRLQADEVIRGRESDIINRNQNKDLFTLLKRFRQQIDLLTQSLIEEGVVTDRLRVETLYKNLGSYLTRSYRLFDEPGFTPGTVAVEKARNFLRGLSTIQKKAQVAAEVYGREYDNELETQIENEINRILGKVDELSVSNEEIVIPFVIGESVKVVDVPFNSFSGIIEEIDEQKNKLRLTVKIIGIKTHV